MFFVKEIIGIAICSLALVFSAFAQTGNVVVCHQKQLWVVNSSNAVEIGDCKSEDWAAKIILAEQPAKQNKPDKNDRHVLNSLRKVKRQQFKPVVLSETHVFRRLPLDSTDKSMYIDRTQLPTFVLDFLESRMEFVISSGLLFGTEYKETFRLIVKLSKSDPTIAEILDEVRKNHPDKEAVKKYGEFYFLEDFSSQKRLDETKRVSEYNMKSGDKFILSMDSAKYLKLPPGVRGGMKKDN